MRIHSFLPIADEQSRLLILGSMPSVRSLEQAQYYANPRNYFWPMLYTLLEKEIDDSYENRKALLHQHHIALWDVCQSCMREGSLDSNITKETPNDIAGFLSAHPNIHAIITNGQKAHQLLKKYFPSITLPVYALPSTSPIPRKTIRCLEDVIGAWQILPTLL